MTPQPPHTRRAADDPRASLWVKSKRTVGGAYRTSIAVARDILLMPMAVWFAITGTSGRMFHNKDITLTDLGMCFLAACCVLGEHGLRLYRNKEGGSLANG